MDINRIERKPQGALAPPPRVYRLTVVQVTSALVVTFRRGKPKVGSLKELESFYRGVLIYNLLLGWWGFPFGLIWTPVALVRNRKAISTLRGLAESGAAAPGWYSDPTGRHVARFWDGNVWTDQVRQTSTDPLSTDNVPKANPGERIAGGIVLQESEAEDAPS